MSLFSIWKYLLIIVVSYRQFLFLETKWRNEKEINISHFRYVCIFSEIQLTPSGNSLSYLLITNDWISSKSIWQKALPFMRTEIWQKKIEEEEVEFMDISWLMFLNASKSWHIICMRIKHDNRFLTQSLESENLQLCHIIGAIKQIQNKNYYMWKGKVFSFFSHVR